MRSGRLRSTESVSFQNQTNIKNTHEKSTQEIISGVDCMFLNPHLCIHDGITLRFRVGPSNSFGSSTDFLRRKKLICVQKNDFLGQNPYFLERHCIFCYHHDSSPKWQIFSAGPVAIGTSGWLPGLKKKHLGPKKVHFGQSVSKNGLLSN